MTPNPDTNTDDPNTAILREAGKIRSGLRRITPHVCPRCGKEFEGIAKAVYCSNACRVHKYQERRKQREKQKVPPQL